MSTFTFEHLFLRRFWLFAAAGVLALALHVGGAALVIGGITGDGDDSLGANAVEIGIDLASPPADITDAPLGPEVEAALPSEAHQAQKAEIKPSDLPKDTPRESEDPDRVVTQNDNRKPTEDDPKVETVQTAAADYSPAAPETARQTFDAPRESETATAPNLGDGKDRQKLAADWGRRISAYFEMHKRYPDVQKGRSAKVRVRLVLNRQGHIVSVAILKSSGDTGYDEAALSMIRRSDPVPRPPAKLTDDQFDFAMDVNFREGK